MMTIIAGQNDDYTIIILMIMTFYPHNHQGQPEICVPMTVNSLPGLFFMSGDWFDLSSRQWQRSRCYLLLHIVVALRGLYSTLFREEHPEKKLLLLADFIKKTGPLL